MKNLSLLFIIASLLFSSCTKFYSYRNNVPDQKYQNKSAGDWDKLAAQNYFVVHFGDDIYEMYDVEFNEFETKITAKYRAFEGKERFYYDVVMDDRDGVARRRMGDKMKYVKQIHFFVKDADYDEADKNLSFKLGDIKQIDVLNQATGVNTAAAIGLGVPITAVSFFVLLIISCNCPHVYIDNGSGLVLTNSMFTGSKAPQLERFDYKQLPDYFPDSSNFSLNIVNELNEDQFTNLLELMVVQHPENLEIFLDKTGKVHTIQAPQVPLSALDNDGENVLGKINFADDDSYRFDPDSLSDLSELKLQFTVPENQANGKLILRAKNAAWAGYVYNQFNSLFGENHEKWVARNKNKTKEEREFWMRQEGIKLLVDIKTPEGWKNIDELELVGETNFNTLVVELDSLPQETLEIRLRSGYMFWELDYAAMDYSADQEVNVQVLKPASTIDNNGTDYTQALSADDANYMAHLAVNSSTKVLFDSLQTDPNLKRSIMLRSKGYYISKDKYAGKTQRRELAKFKTPGELSRFSKRLHRDLLGKISFN